MLFIVFVGKKSPIDDMKKKLACYLYLEIIKSIQSRFVKKKEQKNWPLRLLKPNSNDYSGEVSLKDFVLL